MTSFSLCYLIAAYFLFILLFGGDRYRIHAAIIFSASALNVMFELPGSTDLASYVYNRNVSVLWDGATALILVMFLVFDKVAWKQALLLAFATLCHIMIILHLTDASSIFSLFFYSFYDELIITVGILQMMVSYDGLITALSRLQEYISRLAFNSMGYSASTSSSKKGGESP
jgi:hypothetical protein